MEQTISSETRERSGEATPTAVSTDAPSVTLLSYGGKLTRAELAQIETPAATVTHKPIPHIEVVEKLIETLGFRQIAVVREEYAVSKDGMRMFGVMDLTTAFEGCRFAIGLRNSHDKSFRLSCTVGLRIFVCENLCFSGDYTPVLAKHSKNFSLEDSLAIGVDRMQRNFEPLKRQVEEWQARQLTAAAAKLIIYQAFIEDELDIPKHLARRVHQLYFEPVHPEFAPRTMWSLSNAFTSAFKELEPIPQYKATAKLAGFLESVRLS
jgi:hypothetical protein